jgi:tRNA modification GTPase
MTSDKKILVIMNKMDLVDKKTVEEMKSQLLNYKTLATSMIRGEGIEELENAIDRLFHSGQLQQNEEVLLTNVRHKELIEKAAGSLKEAAQAYQTGLPLDCITIDLLNAAEYLGQITGESVSEDVLHEIFSRFCVGK